MKKRTWKRTLRSVASSLLIAAMLCSEVFAGTTSVTGNTVTVRDYTDNTPILTAYSIYDAEGNVIPIGVEADYAENIAALLNGCGDGQMNASKNACFEDAEDAAQGVAKITFDIVGKPLEISGKDVLFILDESGSMNMGSNSSLGTHMLTSPCLEASHFYRIPADYVHFLDLEVDALALEDETQEDSEATEETVEETESETASTEETEDETASTEGTEDETASTEGTEDETASTEGTEDETASTEETGDETASTEETGDEISSTEGTENETSSTEEAEDEPPAPVEPETETTDSSETPETQVGEQTLACREESCAYRIFPLANASENYYCSEDGNYYIDEDGNIYFTLKNIGTACGSVEDAFETWDNWSKEVSGFIRAEILDYFTGQGIDVSDALGSNNKIKNSWKPWNNHYRLDEVAGFVNIPCPSSGFYCSPGVNSDGCFDRMMMEKDQVRYLAQRILNSETDDRVAAIGFNKNVRTLFDFTNDKGTVNAGLSSYAGNGDTPYEAALQAACSLLNNRGDKTRQPIVVFISDGSPYPEDQRPTSNTVNALKNLGAAIYSVGIRAGSAMEYLTVVGGDNTCNCINVAAFIDELSHLYDSIMEDISDPVLADTIGGSFSLLVDTDHPITIGGNPYYALDTLPPGIRYDSSTKTFTCSLDSVDADGLRITFYVQLAEEFRTGQDAGTSIYATNGSASLTYYPATQDENGTISYEENPTTLPLASPSVRTQTSLLPAQVVSDKMIEGQPVTGQVVKTGDEITYTITVTNDGDADAANVAIVNPIPEGTSYQSCTDDGSFADGAVTWVIPEIPAGESATVSFTVKVTADDTDFVEDIITEQFTWGWNGDTELCDGNVLENPTPVPGTLVITNTVTGNAGDPEKEFHYTITITDPDGNVTTEEFTLKDGQRETIRNLPEGSTYTITQEDANQNGYTTNQKTVTGTIQAGEEAREDYINTKNTGTVVVTNTVGGNAGDPQKEFHYSITYTNKDGKEVTEEFTLKHGEEKEFPDILDGSTYVVTQTDANEDGYVTTQEEFSGTIDKDEPQQAGFENEKNTGKVVVTNTVGGNAGDPQKEFHYTITITDPDGNVTTEEFTLKHGEEKEFPDILDGSTYVVTQTDANEDGYVTTQEEFSGTIDKDEPQRADFENNKNIGTVVVTNTVEGRNADPDKPFHYTITYTNADGEEVTEEFTLKHGEEKEFPGLLADTPYRVAETDANQDGYTANMEEAEGTVIGGETVQEDFVNVINPPTTGSVMITNTVGGNAGDPEKEFHYTVTFTDADGNETVEEFTLKHGQTKTFMDLPDGTKYVVTQEDANQDGYVTPKITAEGTIEAGETVKEEYLNTKNTGTVVVTNTVEGNAADPNRDFHYTITYTDSHGREVTQEFTLKHGEERTFPDILEGTSYTVTQTDADEDGYVTNMRTTGGTIVRDETAQADYINVRNRVSVAVVKVWVDSNNQDGSRPGSILIRLLADGEDTGKQLVLSSTGGWMGSFDDLEQERDGVTIRYTIREDPIPGYTATMMGSADTGFVVYNRHIPQDPMVPKTGDTDNPLLWTLLILLGVVGFLVCMKLSKGKRVNYRR